MRTDHKFDSGDLIAAIVIAVCAVAVMAYLVNGGHGVDEQQYRADENALNELRVQRI